MSLYKRPSSDFWWTKFKHRGKVIRKSTGTRNRREAEKFERHLRVELESAPPPTTPTRVVGLAELGGEDVARAMTKGVGQKQQDSIELCWKHLCRILGPDMEPGSVSRPMMDQYVRTRRAEGVRGQTIRKEIQAIKRGMAIAKREGWAQIVLESWPEIKSDPKHKGQRGKLHPPEIINKWLEEIERDARAIGARDQAELVLLTGLRADEVRKLASDWVQAAPPGLPVPALLTVPEEAAKTGTERVIGLTPRSVEIIERLANGKAPDEPLCPENHSSAFRTASKRIGYHQSITLRDLRHCYETWGAYGTGDAVAAMRAAGHSDLRTTELYLHSTLSRTTAMSVAAEAARGGHKAQGGHSRGGTGTPTPSRPPDRKTPLPQRESGESNGRGGRTRTVGLLLPKQARYQTALHPEGPRD